MGNQLDASIVRILDCDGKLPVGAGFLISREHVLTCTHVIAQVIGNQVRPPDIPSSTVFLDFPLIAGTPVISAHIISWLPVEYDASERSDLGKDVAILKLDQNPPKVAQLAQPVTSNDLWEHPFRAFGFPAGHDEGVWASGVLKGRRGDGWVQIEDVKTPGYSVIQGFSGTPVWDEHLHAVVGMVVASEMQASIKAAFIIPTLLLIKSWPALGQQAIPPCPYRGLFAFREQDAPFFFGREALVAELSAAVQKRQFVALIGPSGSGKSSVVNAGLLAQLRHNEHWSIISLRPGATPLRNLAHELVPLLEENLTEIDRLSEGNKLAAHIRQSAIHLPDVIERILQKRPGTHLLLFIDQFEELYTLCEDQEEYFCFLDAILTTFKMRACMLLIAMRADFLGHALSDRSLADALQYNDLKVGPMTRQELERAIEEPAKKLGVEVEDGLTKRILDAVEREPGNLPLVEFTLTLLWGKQTDGTLRHKAYDELGGVERAIAAYAEDSYAELSENEQEHVRQIFIRLIEPGEGVPDTRRLARRHEIGEMRWALVARLSDARLVISGIDPVLGEETVELVHEALIWEWESLRTWVEKDRQFLLWQKRLRASIQQWEASNHSYDALLRGVLLEEAKNWVLRRPREIGAAENNFIRASLLDKLMHENSYEWDISRMRARTVKFMMLKLRGYLLWFLAVLEFPLILRLIFQLLKTDRQNPFYDITGIFVFPVAKIFPTITFSPLTNEEWTTLLSIVIYSLLFWALASFLTLLISAPSDESWLRRTIERLRSLRPLRSNYMSDTESFWEEIDPQPVQMSIDGQVLAILNENYILETQQGFEEIWLPGERDEFFNIYDRVPRQNLYTANPYSSQFEEAFQGRSSPKSRIYVSPDEIPEDIYKRILLTLNPAIELVIPIQTQLNNEEVWKILYRHAKDLGKDILVISSSRQIRSMAKATKFATAESI